MTELPGEKSGPEIGTRHGRSQRAERWLELWRAGQAGDVRAFLAAAGPLPVEEVLAVLLVEQRQRWQSGQRLPVETYFAWFPVLADDAEAALDLIYGEFLLREQRGEAPTRDDYQARFPQHASDLQKHLDVRALLHASATGSGATWSEPAPHQTWPSAAAGARAEDLPSIPNHELLGELGRGGMGVVYKARNLLLDRIVALKVIRADHLRDAEVVRRFCREIRAAAQLAHPHVVHVYEAGQVGTLPFFTMEYIAGTNLAALVRQQGPLPVSQACRYVRQAALGLQHAHERGLVHRDIKPANLLLSAADGSIKVLDLGLSRLREPAGEPAASTLTREGVMMGTPDFMAPEQILDARTADPRSDLYSLGCTLYYLLTGQPPFSRGSPGEKLAQHLAQEPRMEELRPELPGGLRDLIRKLLAKRPEDRYSSAGELACALADFADGLAPPAGLEATKTNLAAAAHRTPKQRTERAYRPRRAALFGACAILVLGLALWLALRPGPPEPAPPPLAAPASPEAESPTNALQRMRAKVQRQDPADDRSAIVAVDLHDTPVKDEDLACLANLGTLKQLNLAQTSIGDAGLRHLQALTQLETLDLDNTKVGDAGLAHLRGLAPLQTLFLAGSRVSSAGLAHLRGLNRLFSLGLARTAVDDAGLAHLQELPQLAILNLEDTAVADAGLSHLAGLRQLDGLLLSRTRIGDAGLKHLAALPSLRTLVLVKARVSGAGLAHLASSRLGTLILDQTDVDDAALVHIKAMTQLQWLHLAETKIGDAGLAHLGAMVQLKHLVLAQTKLTDTGLKSLAALCQLELLNLARTSVSNAGMEHLAGLSQLQLLDLTDTQVEDAGLVHLQGMRKLEHLNLMDTRVGDAGLAHLGGLSQLVALDLRGTRVSDAGLTHLHGLTRLHSLHLGGTRVTPSAVQGLRKALPAVQPSL
jgi:tRNA A-37 threonylcarbamoyl transferase component Bud32